MIIIRYNTMATEQEQLDEIIDDIRSLYASVSRPQYDDNTTYLSLFPADIRNIIDKYSKYDLHELYFASRSIKDKIYRILTKTIVYITVRFHSFSSIIYFKSEEYAKWFIDKYKGFFIRYELSSILNSACVWTTDYYDALEYGYSFTEWAFQNEFNKYRRIHHKNEFETDNYN